MFNLGRFGWEKIAKFSVPYIFRVVNGERIRYISMYHANNLLLAKYLDIIHPDIISACKSVNGLLISAVEATLLTEINLNYSDQHYEFTAGRDFICRMEEILELYVFLRNCYRKIRCKLMLGNTELFGFIRFHTSKSTQVVPYIVINQKKYVPLFFFKNVPKTSKCLKSSIVKLKNLDLAYLKFCCKVQGITKKVYRKTLCRAIDFDVINDYSPIDVYFEYNYWPIKINDKLELFNQNTQIANTLIKATSTPFKEPLRIHGMVLKNSTRNRKRKSYEQIVCNKIYFVMFP